MQLFPTHSIEQAIGSEDALDVEMLDQLLTRHQDSLMVLAAPPHPDTRERVTPMLVSRIIRTLRETGVISVTDANALRPAGAIWIVPGSVIANAAPAAGRVLLGQVEVRTDANVLVGSGNVIVESVNP
jgi:hypothetical protein